MPVRLAPPSPLPSPSRRLLCAGAAAWLAVPALPGVALAQVDHWEFYEPRMREFSRLRKVADKVVIEFAGQRIEPSPWGQLSEAEQNIVLKAQALQVAPGDEPPYPAAGLRPLIERMHRVRGPVNTPLRLHLGVDENGDIAGLGADSAVSNAFLGEFLQMLLNSGFKPARCDGKACPGRLTLEIVYLGD